MGYPNLTSPRFEHYTETDPRVLTYLHNAFGVEPIRQTEGADLICGNVRVEVKSCQEFIKKTRCKGSTAIRRRGRFKLEGHENADFFLFVLAIADGELLMTMLDAETFFGTYGRTVRTVNWSLIFQPPPPGNGLLSAPLCP
jgi:hypothetical protein